MHWALKSLIVVVAGVVLGLAATWITVVHGDMPGGVSNGPWKTNLAVGSAQSDPYTRASVAIHGLFALNRKETLYYSATTDESGDALDGACRYEIAGRDPDTRWWSVTAYGADDFLIPNSANRYSVAKTTVQRQTDGSFKIQVGGTAKSANWIPVQPGAFSLTLRLYNPGPTASIDPSQTALPTLKKVGCP
jgi:hypothetical protein